MIDRKKNELAPKSPTQQYCRMWLVIFLLRVVISKNIVGYILTKMFVGRIVGVDP